MKQTPQKLLPLVWSIVIALLLGLANASPARADATISPIVLEIGPAGRGALRLTNTGKEAVTYQLTPLSWDVVDSQDLHEPTNDFIASPPTFTLAPRQTREIRVGFRSPQRLPIERAYRLVVEEVPSEVAAVTEGLNVKVIMRYVLPVYIAPATSASDEIVWSVRRQGGSAIVRAENRGNRRGRVDEVGFNPTAATPRQPKYAATPREWVLAQSWREWTVAVPAGVALGTLLVRSGSSDDFQSVPFSQ